MPGSNGNYLMVFDPVSLTTYGEWVRYPLKGKKALNFFFGPSLFDNLTRPLDSVETAQKIIRILINVYYIYLIFYIYIYFYINRNIRKLYILINIYSSLI